MPADRCDAGYDERACIADTINDVRGTVYLTSNYVHLMSSEIYFCGFTIRAPDGYSLTIGAGADSGPFCGELYLIIGEGIHTHRCSLDAPYLSHVCQQARSKVDTGSDYVMVVFHPRKRGRIDQRWVQAICFEARNESDRPRLPVVQLSPTSGYFTLSDFDGTHFMSAWRDVTIPPGHVVMISFPVLKLERYLTMVRSSREG